MSEDSSDRKAPGNPKITGMTSKTNMVLIEKPSKRKRMTSKTKGLIEKHSKKTRMTSKTNGLD